MSLALGASEKYGWKRKTHCSTGSNFSTHGPCFSSDWTPTRARGTGSCPQGTGSSAAGHLCCAPGRQEATAACKQGSGLNPSESSPPSLPPYSPHQEPPCFSTAPADLGCHPDSLNCYTWTSQHQVTLLKCHPSRKNTQLHWQRITCLTMPVTAGKTLAQGVHRSVPTGKGEREENGSPSRTLHTEVTQKLREIYTSPY